MKGVRNMISSRFAVDSEALAASPVPGPGGPLGTMAAVVPKIMFTQEHLETMLSRSWVEETKTEHLCQNCKTIFKAERALACLMATMKFQKTVYFCPECASVILKKQVKRFQELLDGQSGALQKTKPIYDMSPEELIETFKRLPAKTVLGFLRKALQAKYNPGVTALADEGEKVASLPAEMQALVEKSTPAVMLATVDACRYSAFEPAAFERILLEIFRARSKRDLKDRLELPARTPPAVIESCLLKLKPASRLRILGQLKVRLPNLEKLIFPLLMHRILRPKATELLKELADVWQIDQSRVAAAIAGK